MKNKLILVGAITLIIGLGLGYGGAKVLASGAPHAGAAAFNARGAGAFQFQNRAGGAAGAGGLVSGSVVKEDSGSLTVNTRDGSSHVVLLTPDTSVSKSVKGSLADIVVGSEVMVTGTTNSDGSVSASLVQLRPAGSATGTPPRAN